MKPQPKKLNVIIMGDARVGKSTIIEEFIVGKKRRLADPYQSTLEDVFFTKIKTGPEDTSLHGFLFHDYGPVC